MKENPLLASVEQRDVKIKVGSHRLIAHLSLPARVTGWIIFAQLSEDDNIENQQHSLSFNQLGLATLQVRLGAGRSLRPATEWLQVATQWLENQPEAKGLPVSYFGTGLGTAVALQAAAHMPQVKGVVSWNGRPELAWRYLNRVSTPSLLMVSQEETWSRQWFNRAAAWQLSGNYIAVPANIPAVETFYPNWFQQRTLHPVSKRPAPQLTDRIMPLRHGVAIGVLALSLSLSPILVAAAKGIATQVVANQTSATQQKAALDFSDGYAVLASEIAGDGFGKGQTHKATKLTKDAGDGYTLGASDIAGDGFNTPTTGEVALIDAGGLEWLVNTNITFTTSSSASGAASEASFTQAVVATTSAGGTTVSALNDAFDGYNALCVNGSGLLGPCVTSSPDYIMYNQNLTATLECLDPISGTIRQQVSLNPQTVYTDVVASRKVFVPVNDEFGRWMNIFTNTGTIPRTITMVASNNLGSDADTVLDATSSGEITPTATITDTWVTSFQAYSAGTSSDPRLGHVLQGPNAPVPLSGISFVDGEDNPYWAYTFELAPGETKIILNFATGQPSRADAQAKAAELIGLPANALQCMTSQELSQVANFLLPADLSASIDAPATVEFGNPITYAATITNNGPAIAQDLVVTVTLPAGAGFVSASGDGWVCSEASGVVTCTRDTLNVGAASVITVEATAPETTGNITVNVEVSGLNGDGETGNNSDSADTTVEEPTMFYLYLPTVVRSTP